MPSREKPPSTDTVTIELSRSASPLSCADIFTVHIVFRTSDFGCDSAALHELFTVTLDRLAKLGKEADEKIASMEDENSRISANRKKEIDRHHRSLQGVGTPCVRGGDDMLRMHRVCPKGG